MCEEQHGNNAMPKKAIQKSPPQVRRERVAVLFEPEEERCGRSVTIIT